MPETLAYTYTSQAEVERLFTVQGVGLRLADLSGQNLTDYWTELVADATDKINEYVSSLYDESALADSRWVRSRATWIAAHYLSMRQGNAEQFVKRYDEIIDELYRAQNGAFSIPRVSRSSANAPVVSNIVMDERYAQQKQRITPGNSTGDVLPSSLPTGYIYDDFNLP